MKVLIPALCRATLALAVLIPIQAEAGLFDFIRGGKEPDTSEFGSQETAAKAMLKNANGRERDRKYEASRRIHESIVETYPLTNVAAQSQFKIGELYELQREDSDAFDAYNDFISKYKESSLFSTAVERQYEIAQRGSQGKTESFLGIDYKMQPSRLIEMYTAISKNAPYSKYAPLSQYTIGDIHAEQDKIAEAITAYQQVVSDYPNDKKAAEAQFRIGELLTDASKKGNNDQAHLRQTRQAYEEFLIQFPEDEMATVAIEQLSEIEAREITKTFEIAQFYENSGKLKAAAIYYGDVLKHPSAKEYEEAKARMDILGEQGDLVIGNLDLTPEIVAVPAEFDVKSRADYLGPPAPKLASIANRRSMRNSMEDLEPVQIIEPDLPSVTEDPPTEAPVQGLLPAVAETPSPPSPFQTLLRPSSTTSILDSPSSPILSTLDTPPTAPSDLTLDTLDTPPTASSDLPLDPTPPPTGSDANKSMAE